MREFRTYLANWNKFAFGTATADSAVAADKFPSAVWAIAHVHLRSRTVVSGQRLHEEVALRLLR
jgi:hypothetical protein